MKFVLVFWCDVWVFEFVYNQVVDDEMLNICLYVYFVDFAQIGIN